MIHSAHIHMQDSQIRKGFTAARGLVLWIHSSQLTIWNNSHSQMNHNSQGNHSAHTPQSPQRIGTTPSPTAGGWGMREMSWVLTHLPARLKWYTVSDGFNRFPHSTGMLHPMGADPLLGWLANGSWFVCFGVWLFAAASWLIC